MASVMDLNLLLQLELYGIHVQSLIQPDFNISKFLTSFIT